MPLFLTDSPKTPSSLRRPRSARLSETERLGNDVFPDRLSHRRQRIQQPYSASGAHVRLLDVFLETVNRLQNGESGVAKRLG